MGTPVKEDVLCDSVVEISFVTLVSQARVEPVVFFFLNYMMHQLTDHCTFSQVLVIPWDDLTGLRVSRTRACMQQLSSDSKVLSLLSRHCMVTLLISYSMKACTSRCRCGPRTFELLMHRSRWFGQHECHFRRWKRSCSAFQEMPG